MRTIEVALAQDPYPVVIGSGALADLGSQVLGRGFKPGTKVLVVTNPVVQNHYGTTALTSLQAAGFDAGTLVIEAGEDQKTPATVASIHDAAFARKLERGSLIVALGGGVVGDMAGFAAASWLRGIAVVQVPTTLLAMVDASIGGKTGVNHPGGKNLIGAFHQPLAVISDISLLSTLPRRELAAGYAEVAKYGLLGDKAFFEWLEGSAPAIMRGNSEALIRAIRSSCEAKARIVAEDETETGVRALLNLGHTFGHALEAATGYSQRLLHGEGVAIGMVQAFRFSERQGLCAPGAADRVAKHLKSAGLPVHASQIPGDLPPPATLLEIMRQDKKAQGGKLTFILVRGIGDAFIARDVAEHDVLDFLTGDLRQR